MSEQISGPTECTKESFCAAMYRHLEGENGHHSGMSVATMCSVTTGKFWVGGVIYKRRIRKKGDPGTFLNYCPWCGKSIMWARGDGEASGERG